MTVTIRGQERTLAQMAPFLEETDRAVRQEAWELAASRRSQDSETLDEMFDQMMALRIEIATEAGFDEFRRVRLPSLASGSTTASRRRSGFTRPWSASSSRWREKSRSERRRTPRRRAAAAVGPRGRSAGPRRRSAVQGRRRARRGHRGDLHATSTRSWASSSRSCVPAQLLDLDSRKGKAPGGYQTTLEEAGRPFIFMNAVGLRPRRRTLLHEGGHAFHAAGLPRRAARRLSRQPAWSSAEVASMGMELLGARPPRRVLQPATTWPGPTASCSKASSLILPWIATIDAFQHWIYSHPATLATSGPRPGDDLLERFGGIVDWSATRAARDYSWQRQLHIFVYPFYYIEYGIAQLGALQIWQRSLNDRAAAVAEYRKAPGAGRLAAAARAVRRRRHPLRLRRRADRPADGDLGRELEKLSP